jgi:hypothetical protein
MAVNNRDDLVAALSEQHVYPYFKTVPATSFAGNALVSMWKAAGQPGAAGTPPTTAATCNSSTAGALRYPAPASGKTWYLANFTGLRWPNTHDGPLYLMDRLSHVSGLSGTVATAQTVGCTLPTRVIDKTTVQIWIEVYTALGATARALTVSYTNENGVAGRTGTLLGGVPANLPASQMLGPLEMQAGDMGVTSVDTLTLAGSTGTAGNFGVTLVRQIASLTLISPNNSAGVAYTGCDQLTLPWAGLIDIGADSCLMLAAQAYGTAGVEVGEIALCSG